MNVTTLKLGLGSAIFFNHSLHAPQGFKGFKSLLSVLTIVVILGRLLLLALGTAGDPINDSSSPLYFLTVVLLKGERGGEAGL